MAEDAPIIAIRQAGPTDITTMAGLLGQLFSIEVDFAADADRQRRGLQLLLQQPLARAMVAEINGRLVGMCSGQLTVSTAEGGFALLIEDLIVEADCRGRQIGRRLLAAIARWAKGHGATRMQLLADRHNHPARSFYRRLDWRQTDLICLRRYHLPEMPSEALDDIEKGRQAAEAFQAIEVHYRSP